MDIVEKANNFINITTSRTFKCIHKFSLLLFRPPGEMIDWLTADSVGWLLADNSVLMQINKVEEISPRNSLIPFCLQCISVKGKFVPVFNQALRQEILWESGCIDPNFLDLETSWR
jgi:hypothetical protein